MDWNSNQSLLFKPSKAVRLHRCHQVDNWKVVVLCRCPGVCNLKVSGCTGVTEWQSWPAEHVLPSMMYEKKRTWHDFVPRLGLWGWQFKNATILLFIKWHILCGSHWGRTIIEAHNSIQFRSLVVYLIFHLANELAYFAPLEWLPFLVCYKPGFSFPVTHYYLHYRWGNQAAETKAKNLP